MSDTSTYSIPDGIMAMTEDDGTVVTLLKRDQESGAVYRHDGQWLPLVDPTVLDDLSFVGVTDDAEGVYDTHEAQDELVTIGSYAPSGNGPFWPYAVTISSDETAEDEDSEETGEEALDVDSEDDTVDEPLAASVVLNSAEDLTAAIAAAVEDPEIRWYVERRMRALGIEADLPWQEV